jgi:hypothetical protein
MLAGNVAALLSPMVFVPIFTFIFGKQNYDYESMRNIRKVDDSDVAAAAHVDLELIPGETTHPEDMTEEEVQKLNKAAFYARTLTVVMTLCLLILWPMPMYGTGYVFSKTFFRGWVVVGILWLFCTAFGVVLFPLWEGRDGMAYTIRAMYLDFTGKKKPTLQGREGIVVVSDKTAGEPSTGETSPAEKLSVTE